ncbi:MAG: hypothetical protein COV70_01885 [Parcubacteria group bacterium CG11_big_fil_rev_8_21_14_0_20_39_22]|nr:MAG: hypothetical protein COV70_01885 [Parcubacteria group bacterium CG11_big_fil_rev_8_21_14_0_20_39_22]
MPVYNDIDLHKELDNSKLPEKVKSAIKSIEVAPAVLDIGEGHDLLISEIGEIYEATKSILLGKTRTNDFVDTVATKLGKERRDKAGQVAEEINKRVLLKVREAMMKSPEETQTDTRINSNESPMKPVDKSADVQFIPSTHLPTEKPLPQKTPEPVQNVQEDTSIPANLPTGNDMPKLSSQNQYTEANQVGDRKSPYKTMGQYSPVSKKPRMPENESDTNLPPAPKREDILREIEKPRPTSAIELDAQGNVKNQNPPSQGKYGVGNPSDNVVNRDNGSLSGNDFIMPPPPQKSEAKAQDALLSKISSPTGKSQNPAEPQAITGPSSPQKAPESYAVDPYREPLG